MIDNAFFFLFIFLCEVAAQGAWIRYMRARHISQHQKAYGTRIDEEIKEKVPSLGGVVFLLIGSGLLISEAVKGDVQGMIFWCFPILSSAVGLADDLLKLKTRTSEGLTSIQKFLMQSSVTLLWFVLLAVNGMTPAFAGRFTIGPLIWPAAFFFTVGAQNAVNVTDGLDGLAAGASAVSFAVLLYLGCGAFGGAVAGAAMAAGFLWHNAHPAQVFMGDGGAHFLAGLMASCAITGSGVLALIPASALFGIEMISVVIQIVAIRRFGRKVFRMSPIHHHFQLLGWGEDTIVIRFWLIHVLGCLLLTACAGILSQIFTL